MLHAAHVAHKLLCDTERAYGIPEGSLLYDNASATKFWNVFVRAGLQINMDAEYLRKEFLRHHMFAAWYRYGRPTFDLGPGLVHQMAETSPGAARMVDLAWPFPVFMLTIPERESPIFGWRAEGPSKRPLIHILCSVAQRAHASEDEFEAVLNDPLGAGTTGQLSKGKPIEERLRDALLIFAIGADRNMNSITRALPIKPLMRWDEWITSTSTMRMTRTDDGQNLSKVVLHPEERRAAQLSIEALERFIICVSLYLSPKNEEYAKAREEQVRKGKTGMALRFRVGQTVKIDPTRRTRVIARGRDIATQSSEELAQWVRGHMQRYHFKKGGERTEWVPKEAYFKGLNPQDAVERKFTAEVKPNKETEE
jgi:hypothetical protein